MNLELTMQRQQKIKMLGLIGLVMVVFMSFNTLSAQNAQNVERSISGLVSNEDGPLLGVNVTLKDTRIGTTTDEDGKFTFPKKLINGDVLIFSYLGYETQKMTIEAKTSFIKLELTTDMVEMIGALDTGKPYKSKRKKS
ncbi:carboxypeptidase-like regulatory domain-containing protein [uncultured Winogradskyella sp.]|uniref:carboxypeptidase-like regulatory domain-containing protein n=1 Tax=uncultured Winogradskyella sp. TaxID=395353 RepID=UPI00260F0B0E|nr:carboxypeptidase-like regulatory domain-containing protein [uncultured Winogradskyella sp.]